MAKSRRKQPGDISSPRQIQVLASAVRQDILDTVEAAGPCSVAELARLLGANADGLYYHIRSLSRAGLLAVTSSRGASGRSEALLNVAGDNWIKYQPNSAVNRSAVIRVVGSMLRNAHRQFGRAFRPESAVVSGPKRNLWAARMRGFLAPRDVERANALLHELRGLFEPSKSRSRSAALHEITFVIAPVVSRRGRTIGKTAPESSGRSRRSKNQS